MSIKFGVGSAAKEVKNIYFGVNGTARKVTKGYIGDADGKARLWYETEEPSVELIEFTIFQLSDPGNVQLGTSGDVPAKFKAEYGMSFFEWAKSKYCNNAYSVLSEPEEMAGDMVGALLRSPYVFVLAADFPIENGQVYAEYWPVEDEGWGDETIVRLGPI